jgi:hypothetical protein
MYTFAVLNGLRAREITPGRDGRSAILPSGPNLMIT